MFAISFITNNTLEFIIFYIDAQLCYKLQYIQYNTLTFCFCEKYFEDGFILASVNIHHRLYSLS